MTDYQPVNYDRFNNEPNAHEVETKRLMSEAVRGSKSWEQEVVRCMIGQTFVIEWASSLPVERIIQIGRALYPHFSGEQVDEAIKQELTALVRAKFLRSRMHSGKRLYEVNY